MEQVKEVMYGDVISTIAQVRHILNDLDDNDIVVLETCDDHGDVIDLFPMYMDVIDGIKLQDNTIVREVRFCQRPNSEPDTRDKQPLVNAVISELENDLSNGDQTVLDELLKHIPWEILKHSLPEEMWGRFNEKNPSVTHS